MCYVLKKLLYLFKNKVIERNFYALSLLRNYVHKQLKSKKLF